MSLSPVGFGLSAENWPPRWCWGKLEAPSQACPLFSASGNGQHQALVRPAGWTEQSSFLT